jgi:hypothetical protein
MQYEIYNLATHRTIGYGSGESKEEAWRDHCRRYPEENGYLIYEDEIPANITVIEV